MADTSIYRNLLAPPKSVAELDAEAMAGQQNKLSLMLNQQKAAEYSRGIEQENALAQAYKGAVGADGTVDRNKLYSGAAQAGLGAKLPGMQKGYAELDETAAKTAHAKSQAQKEKFDIIVKANGMVGSAAGAIMQNPDPAHAAQVVAGLRSTLGPELAAQLGLDALQIPQDPAALKQWANDHYLQSIDTDKQLADARTKSEGLANRQNQTQIAAANNATSRANNASSNAVTMRGQNMTDARGREINANAREDLKTKAAIGKAPTEFQGKSAAFGARADQADKIISALEGKYNPSAINAKQSVENTWLIGGALGAATNRFAMTEQDQQAEQAQRDFVNAVLRQESGAAIGESEFANAKKQYFPQPGDKPATLAQKSQNRKLAIKGFNNNAGRAAFSSDAPDPTAAALPSGWSVKEH